MKSLKNLVKLLLVVVLLLAGLVIGLDNNQAIQLNLLDWTTPNLPLYQWLFVFLALGFIAGLMFMLASNLRLQMQLSSSRRQNRKLQQQVDTLPGVPAGSEVE